MINTDDKLICVQGNDFYSEGKVYTVGRIVNNKYFQILTNNNIVTALQKSYDLDEYHKTI